MQFLATVLHYNNITHPQQLIVRFALEVDRGSEPLKILLAKGLMYRTLAESGHYRATLGVERGDCDRDVLMKVFRAWWEEALLVGADDAERGFVSLLLLPAEAARPLAAVSDAQARALLGEQYMANAHPTDLLRQNCNQWLAELLASAWGPPAAEGGARQAAQRQLAAWDYRPEPVQYGTALWRAAAAFVPWVSMQGHPDEDLAANRLVTSLPTDLEALARRLFPGARRVELCYTASHWVLRREGPALSDDCRAEDGDESQPF